jgi:hypothetical protein
MVAWRMPIRRSYDGIAGAAVPDVDALEGLRASATSEGARAAPLPERYFVAVEVRRRTPRFAELVLDDRVVARLTGQTLSLYQAIDAAIGQQDIVLAYDESVELTGDLSFLARDHQDVDGRLILRKVGAPEPVKTVRFGGAAGQARPALWRPAPAGAGGGASAGRASS